MRHGLMKIPFDKLIQDLLSYIHRRMIRMIKQRYLYCELYWYVPSNVISNAVTIKLYTQLFPILPVLSHSPPL